MAASTSQRVSELSALAAAGCACDGLRRAARAVSKVYETAFAPLGLTATQFSILTAVHLGGPFPLSRLAERLVLDRTTLYRAVKPLVRRGSLKILPGRTGRERTATLTEAGRRLLTDALPIWEATQARFVEALGPRAWASLTSGLTRVVPTAQDVGPGTPSPGSGPSRRIRHR